ncbi:MAG: hypothetical protein R6X14_07515 [bacterium]
MRYLRLVLLLGLLAPGCRQETAVVGELILESGHVGDVRASRVELHATFDLSEAPVAAVTSDDGRDERRSAFHLSGMPAGSYYLLAWQDVDRDGRISDRDIVGVRDGSYRPGYGGTPVEVFDGAETDVRNVTVSTWRDPVASVTGRRSAAFDTTEFLFGFNYDLELTALSVTFPGLGTLLDPDAPGPKLAGVEYVSGGWVRGGAEMPAGRHVLHLTGRLEGESFNLALPVDVP